MTGDVVLAIQQLQGRIGRVPTTRNRYWTERYERALDELVRNPDKTGNPTYLARNASANAGKVLKRRLELCTPIQNSEDDDAVGRQPRGVSVLKDPAATRALEEVEDTVAAGELRLVIDAWFAEADLSDRDRTVVEILLREGDEYDVARQLDLTLSQARVCVSRARARARSSWQNWMVAA